MDHFGQAAQAVTLSYVLASKHKEEGLLGEDSSPGLEMPPGSWRWGTGNQRRWSNSVTATAFQRKLSSECNFAQRVFVEVSFDTGLFVGRPYFRDSNRKAE